MYWLRFIKAWLIFLATELVRNEVGSINVKSVAQVADKWAQVTPGRSQYYQSGASVAGGQWEEKTLAAKAAFKAAVSAGNIDSLFAGGVKKAGGAKYQRKVVDVGVSRFSSGVTAAKQDFADGMAPMLETIASVNLPMRAPRGSEANLERVRAVATALNRKRLALRASSV